MGKKKNRNNNNNSSNNEAKNEGNNVKEEKPKGNEGGEEKKKKKDETPVNDVVLKIEMHCQGCVSKITKHARSFKGVDAVKAEMSANKLTVKGEEVDAEKLRDYLQDMTNKKVEIQSPKPKKEENKQNNNNNHDGKSDDKKPNAQKSDDNKKKQNDDGKKQKDKEAPVTTAVIKLDFHCQGCIEKMKKIIKKTKGFKGMEIDEEKETVTVKGSMDAKALTESLKEKLRRPVELVQPKKEKNSEGGENDGKGKKKGGGNGQENAGGDGGNMGGNRMEFIMQQPGYGPPPGYGFMGQPVYGPGYQPVYMNGTDYGYGQPPVYGYGNGYGYAVPMTVPGYPAHMRFNDENPNACIVM